MTVRREMTTREVARELGIAHGTVERIEERALKKLRAALEQRGIRYEDLVVERGLHPLAAIAAGGE